MNANRTVPAGILLEQAPVPLSGWYGDPVSQKEAESLLQRVERQQQAWLRDGYPCFRLQVLALIGHYWLGCETTAEYKVLAALAPGRPGRALLELVQGQLLASRKCRGALQYLQNGFSQAAPLLMPDEYLELVRRHELLACLSYSGSPSSPQHLASLLREAAVVKRLQKDMRQAHGFARQDTVG